MKRNKKVIIPVAVVLCVLALLGAYKLVDSVCYPYVEMRAQHYLCKKYNAEPSEIELVDYRQAHIYWDDYQIFILTPKWLDFSFEYEYNDRTVIVNRFEGKFYDDYQLEDIEKWCTEWLQENVDEMIVGIEIESTDILNYINYTKISRYHIIAADEAKAFLDSFVFSDDDSKRCIIDFKKNNANDYIDEKTSNLLITKLRMKFNMSDNIYPGFTLNKLCVYVVKDENELWKRMFVTKELFNSFTDIE